MERNGRADIMGIIIAVAIIFAAVFFRLRYRPEGENASTMFTVCLMAGAVMLLTVGSLSSWSGLLFYAVEIALCALMVLSYRYEARRQAAVRARKRAAVRRAAREQKVIQLEQRRPLTCFAAFTESVGEAA